MTFNYVYLIFQLKVVCFKILLNILDKSDMLLIHSLCASLVPSERVLTNFQSKSIQQCQNGIFMNINRETEIPEILYNRHSVTVTPMIFKVSGSKRYLLCFHDVRYLFDNLISAIETCFHIYHVFKLQYALDSVKVWTFFQNWFYELLEVDIAPEAPTFPDVSILLNHLKLKKESYEESN